MAKVSIPLLCTGYTFKSHWPGSPAREPFEHIELGRLPLKIQWRSTVPPRQELLVTTRPTVCSPIESGFDERADSTNHGPIQHGFESRSFELPTEPPEGNILSASVGTQTGFATTDDDRESHEWKPGQGGSKSEHIAQTGDPEASYMDTAQAARAIAFEKPVGRATEDALIHDVIEFVLHGLQFVATLPGGRPVVVLIGESHISTNSLRVVMSALKAVRVSGEAHGTLVLEQRPPHARVVAEHVLQQSGQLKERWVGELQFVGESNSETYLTRLSAGILLKVHTAQQLGFQVAGHDRLGTKPGRDPLAQEREDDMVATLKEQLADPAAGPLVVVAGSNHVKFLRESLSDEAHVITITGTHPEFAGPREPRYAACASYLLGHPDLLRYDSSDSDGVGAIAFDYDHFAQKLGIPTANS
jgi:hypothetical protein